VAGERVGAPARPDDEEIDMTGALQGRRIAVMVANEGVERVELTEPWDAIAAAGGEPVLIAPETGDVRTFDHLDAAEVRTATVATADASPDDYDGLILPGGVANPDQLRMDAAAVGLVRSMVAAGTPVGVICHGPWTLVEADVVRDRTLTSWPSLHTDITNAGGLWVDQEVVVCDHGPNVIVSSRNPGDLPVFCRTVTELFSGQGRRIARAS
jgi:protease I